VYQEVFLAYHRKQPDCNDEDHRKAWLITTTLVTARRIALTTWATRVTPTDPVGLTGFDSQQFSFGDIEEDNLFAAIRRLPERFRTVLHLRYISDLPVKDVAAALGIAEPAARKRLERARTVLKQQLEQA
jgi:RNA polymerase sigma-70 factor (ECF subfamily)